MEETKVKDNKDDQEAQYKVRWTGVRDLLNSSGEFFKITKPDGQEEWVRKDAIFSFRVVERYVYLRVFGSSAEISMYFPDRWQALKLCEEIATAVAKEQRTNR